MANASPQLNIVLHQPEIPQNTGNIGRTCVATGSKLWIVRPCGFQLDDRHIRRAGMDYWSELDLQVVDTWADLVQRLDGHKFYYFSRHATRAHWSAEFSNSDVLVFGSESQGLPSTIVDKSSDAALQIPMADDARSLNLSNAVAIATYEALRQTST